jgi:hypothetical protein
VRVEEEEEEEEIETTTTTAAALRASLEPKRHRKLMLTATKDSQLKISLGLDYCCDYDN